MKVESSVVVNVQYSQESKTVLFNVACVVSYERCVVLY